MCSNFSQNFNEYDLEYTLKYTDNDDTFTGSNGQYFMISKKENGQII